MHLQEGEERLEDGVGDEDVLDAGLLHGGVHRDLEAGEDQGAQAEDWNEKELLRGFFMDSMTCFISKNVNQIVHLQMLVKQVICSHDRTIFYESVITKQFTLPT